MSWLFLAADKTVFNYPASHSSLSGDWQPAGVRSIHLWCVIRHPGMFISSQPPQRAGNCYEWADLIFLIRSKMEIKHYSCFSVWQKWGRCFGRNALQPILDQYLTLGPFTVNAVIDFAVPNSFCWHQMCVHWPNYSLVNTARQLKGLWKISGVLSLTTNAIKNTVMVPLT